MKKLNANPSVLIKSHVHVRSSSGLARRLRRKKEGPGSARSEIRLSYNSCIVGLCNQFKYPLDGASQRLQPGCCINGNVKAERIIPSCAHVMRAGTEGERGSFKTVQKVEYCTRGRLRAVE
uniref:Uncharacterized protein n=1 Tax=Anopheles melas TaxID=34690 RepID=A0A182UJU1_9DIPT